jgi:hypothetical protein
MSLAGPIVTLLAHFQSAFTNPTCQKKRVLLVGILLAHGRLVLLSTSRCASFRAAGAPRGRQNYLIRDEWWKLHPLCQL